MVAPRFADNFWGEKDNGFEVLLNHMRHGKQTCKDILEIVNVHAAIEEDYSRKLAKLSKMSLGEVRPPPSLLQVPPPPAHGPNPGSRSPRAVYPFQNEHGTLREALLALRTELDQTSQLHANMARDLRSRVHKALNEFMMQQSKQRKSKAKQMAKIHKTKLAQQSLVVKTRQVFQKRVQEAASMKELARRPGLSQKEADKVAAKERKAVAAADASDSDFKNAIEKLQRIQEDWVTEMRDTTEVRWKAGQLARRAGRCMLTSNARLLSDAVLAATQVFQRLEEERLDYIKATLITYTEVVAEGATGTEQSCQRVRASLEECNVDTDITEFVNSNATGTEVPGTYPSV